MTATLCRGLATAAAAASLIVVGLLARAGDKPAPRPLGLEDSLLKAGVDGKYAMLLRQFKAEKDHEKYGSFRDLGPRTVHEYGDVKDIPDGRWVYVYPYWYVWRDLADAPITKRNWGPEQATGPPDTTGPGDIVTAWASETPDGQDEWLMLEYDHVLLPSAVVVHETFNPGALVRVTAFRLDGEEVELWKGKDPSPVNPNGVGVSEVEVKPDFKTNRIKLYLDSKAVPGWNEIDAVGVRDGAGKMHWAVAAAASSTYAQLGAGGGVGAGIIPGGFQIAVPAPAPPAAPPAKEDRDARIKKLTQKIEGMEEDEKELHRQIEELKKKKEEIKKEKEDQ
jgi:hypothetical protein